MDAEVENYISSLTNMKNQNDVQAGGSMKLLSEYPDQFKLEIKKNQVVQALLFYDQDLKTNSNIKVSEQDISNYYYKNLASFIEPPSEDIIVVAVTKNPSMSLEAQGVLEGNFQESPMR